VNLLSNTSRIISIYATEYHHPTVSSSEITNIEREAVQLQINLYKQIREQLLAKIKLYQLQHKVELARIISESI
jgi:hypothetical protein